MNKKLIIMLSLAVIIAMAVTAFPLHIERSHNSDWPFVITIGSPVSAQEADYTCDGADDNVQFQAALDALPGAGGQLFVLAGNYTFADSTTVTRAIDHVSIIGVSAAVSFTGDGTTAIFTAGGDGWLFSNIEADSGGLAMGATTDYMWLHVIVDSTYYPLKTDAINIEDHSALHGVGGADTVFPADPDADKFLLWDDDPGELVWSDAGAGDGDMQKATYDQDEDGDIDTAAGGTEWDSSAATGVAYITAGAWGTRSTGISNTYIIIVDDADAANGDIPYFTTSGLAGYNEAEFKTAYNMEAGTDYQAYDAELAAIAGLTSAANKMIYFTGSGTADVSDLTAFARSILDDTDEATFKATVNLEIGTDVQAQDAELSALAGLTSAADKLPYFTGSGTADVTGLSAFTRGFLDDVDEATFKATTNLEIGTDVQAWDGDLDDIAALSDADSNFIVGNGANWVVESGATVRESLGLIIGTNVQAYDAELAALAGLTSAADKLPYFTGSETAGVTDLTAYGRGLVAVADEAAFKLLVNLEIGVDIISKATFDTHESATTGVHGVTGTIVGTEDIEWSKYSSNPILSPEGTEDHTTALVVWYDSGTYHGFYSYHDGTDDYQIGHATSDDGLSWTKDSGNNPILVKGSGGSWDDSGVVATSVWKEGATWYMIYRGDAGSSVYAAGLATASSPEGTWTKSGSNPVLQGTASEWDEGSVEIWGIIKVSTTYYAYYSRVATSRQIGIATSSDLTTWSKDGNNPIFTGERFTPAVFKKDSYYYLVVPRYNKVTTPRKSVFEIYRDSSPTFYANSREYLGVVASTSYVGWDCATIDGPYILTDDIDRDTYTVTSNELWCYYHAYNSTGTWQSGLLIEPDIDDAIGREETGEAVEGIAKNAIMSQYELFSGCSVYRGTSAQSIPNNTMTQLELNTEYYDILDEYDSTTDYEWTATHPCVILVTSCVYLASVGDGTRISMKIQKNSSAIFQTASFTGAAGTVREDATTVCTVDTGDTVTAWIYQLSGGAIDTDYAGGTVLTIQELMPL